MNHNRSLVHWLDEAAHPLAIAILAALWRVMIFIQKVSAIVYSELQSFGRKRIYDTCHTNSSLIY